MIGIRKFNSWMVFWLGLALLFVPCFGAGESLKKSEIVIIGTVHQPTAAYTSESLLDILRRVKPDVILMEKDSSFFTNEFKLREFKSDSMEPRVIRAYLKETDVPLRPFDIEGRNDFYRRTNYFEQEKALFAEISKMYKANKLNGDAKALWEALKLSMDDSNRWQAKDSEKINSYAYDSSVNAKHWNLDQGILELIRLTPELANFYEFQGQSAAFEMKRNDAMVQNIRRWSREFQGRRLVVIVGCEHRHYLRSHLGPDEPITYVLKEYWEFPALKKIERVHRGVLMGAGFSRLAPPMSADALVPGDSP